MSGPKAYEGRSRSVYRKASCFRQWQIRWLRSRDISDRTRSVCELEAPAPNQCDSLAAGQGPFRIASGPPSYKNPEVYSNVLRTILDRRLA
ncbi:hypothetical protein [Halomicronema hongdechloris]|uniref:hypothetical protein n=1 Tax=Halomicronema hongdechloris TaxID=1209493 RepID=UPI0010CC6D0A|nr:hypothetical protein [Halomicronema hongdechloris]